MHFGLAAASLALLIASNTASSSYCPQKDEQFCLVNSTRSFFRCQLEYGGFNPFRKVYHRYFVGAPAARLCDILHEGSSSRPLPADDFQILTRWRINRRGLHLFYSYRCAFFQWNRRHKCVLRRAIHLLQEDQVPGVSLNFSGSPILGCSFRIACLTSPPSDSNGTTLVRLTLRKYSSVEHETGFTLVHRYGRFSGVRFVSSLQRSDEAFYSCRTSFRIGGLNLVGRIADGRSLVVQNGSSSSNCTADDEPTKEVRDDRLVEAPASAVIATAIVTATATATVTADGDRHSHFSFAAFANKTTTTTMTAATATAAAGVSKFSPLVRNFRYDGSLTIYSSGAAGIASHRLGTRWFFLLFVFFFFC